MLKVCGVTFDHTTNYGSCLQAFALQKVIEDMVIDNERCEYQLIPHRTFPAARPKGGSPVLQLKRFIARRMANYRRSKFQPFETRYMHFAECNNQKKLGEIGHAYDAYVCGSDVIWNLSFTKADPIYFLDFAERYKFSYAASFGVKDIDHDYTGFDGDELPSQIFARYLPTLNSIGVREKSAVEIVRKIAGMPAEQVCDPVLLLTADQWRSIASTSNRKPYIFAYSTHPSDNYLSFINRLKRQTGLPVIHVTWDLKTALFHGALLVPTPEEWLGLLAGAEYVVTNSFHATVFSCIFHKNFYWAKKTQTVQGIGIRLYDFLQEMGLVNRAYGNTPDIIDTAPPCFDKADICIQQQRERSLAFLHTNLEAAYRQKILKRTPD